MKKQKTFSQRTCAFLIVALLLFELAVGFFGIRASAASQYSSPLEDLEATGNFDATDYPDIATDYSIQVIALAESVDGELYVYVYQPCAATKLLTATSITIDAPINDESRNFRIYSLTLLGVQGVFHKYRVNSLTLRETPVRKYSVSEIFRAFDSKIDIAPDFNTISEKAYPVGKMWTLSDAGSTTSTEVVYEDVIDVTEKHIGYVKYDKGSVIDAFLGYTSQIHSHYIAFSTDRPIDKIFEVDVYFKTQSVNTYPEENAGLWTETTRGPKEEHYITLTSSQVLEINTSGFHPDYYKYKRIQSVDAFLEMEKQDITNQDGLEGKEWILRFYETTWSDTITSTGSGGMDGGVGVLQGSARRTEVTDVALLRIEYEYDGVVYNLGVVDDMQTGSKEADGSHGGMTVEDLLGLILGAIGLVLIFTVFWPFVTPLISAFFNFLWFGFKALLRFAFWLITLPFKLIGRLLFRDR